MFHTPEGEVRVDIATRKSSQYGGKKKRKEKNYQGKEKALQERKSNL